MSNCQNAINTNFTPFFCRRPHPHHPEHFKSSASKMSEELPYKTAAASASHQQPRETLISPVGSNLGMDKSTLKVHLPDGSFNVVRFGDATDIKVRPFFRQIICRLLLFKRSLLLKIGNFYDTHAKLSYFGILL